MDGATECVKEEKHVMLDGEIDRLGIVKNRTEAILNRIRRCDGADKNEECVKETPSLENVLDGGPERISSHIEEMCVLLDRIEHTIF